MSFPSDLDIARSVTPRPIVDIAAELGLGDDELELYGPTKAKVTLEAIRRLEAERPRGKYVVVTAITPTPLGEGKSTTTVGLAQGLNRIGKRASVNIRQPSLGPVFGIKGGAAGGGYSQVIPMEDFNLHLTGDVHAIGAAHNLAGAFIDNSLHHKNPLGIDPHGVLWPRVLDISDRALRNVVIGLGGREDGVPRQTEFVITVGSEVMAVLALATDLFDLRARLGRMVLATRVDGSAVTADDLGVAGSMTVLLRDAIKPNLLQTLEGGPAFVHCGPFANIAHGNNSIIADRLALVTNDIVCTEAGFGADMGAEKFFDIKCRASGLVPDAAVVVATVRALKMHGGVGRIVAGKPLDPALLEENVDAVRAGAANLAAHVDIVRRFGIPAVVAINAFPRTRLPRSKRSVRSPSPPVPATRCGPRTSSMAARGRRTLRKPCWAATEEPDRAFRLLYPDDAPLGEKILTIVKEIYGGDGIELLPTARKRSSTMRTWATGTCRCAWRRPSTRSATTPTSRVAPAASPCRSARSACRPAPASSRRCAARCGRCRGSRRNPVARTSTSTLTGTSSGCSSRVATPATRIPNERPDQARDEQAAEEDRHDGVDRGPAVERRDVVGWRLHRDGRIAEHFDRRSRAIRCPQACRARPGS